MKAAGIAVILGLLAVWYAYGMGYDAGVAETWAEYAKQADQHRVELANLKRESRERLRKRERELQAKVQRSDRKIRELLNENANFKAWHESRPPVDVGDLIYGDGLQP